MKAIPFNAVLCIENALLREGLVRILSEIDVNIVSSNPLFPDGQPGLAPDEPGVLLIVDASDDFDAAIGQIDSFKLTYPNGRIAVLVGRHQLQLAKMISAFRNGASAYLTTFMNPDAFVKSLELVMLGETIVPLAMLTYLTSQRHDRSHHRTDGQQKSHDINGTHNEYQEDRACGEDDCLIKTAPSDTDGRDAPHLSARQSAILRCLLEGHSNKVIARKMKIADATVKVHIKTILRKIRVENRTQAALWAMRNGPLISANHNGGSITTKFQSRGFPLPQRAKPDGCESCFQDAPSSTLGTDGASEPAMPHSVLSEWKTLHQKGA